MAMPDSTRSTNHAIASPASGSASAVAAARAAKLRMCPTRCTNRGVSRQPGT